MKNSAIIKDLLKNYRGLKETPSQRIVLDEEFSNHKDLDKWKKIDLILVGDNPGKMELKEDEYFSEKGNAGKHARTFLEAAKYLSGNNLTCLILNKTPYHSPKTSDLTIDTDVESSVIFLIDALKKFAEYNDNVIILIVGYSENLNKYFYPQLYEQARDELRKKLYFAKHFSRGNFFEQFIRNYFNEDNKQSPSLLKEVLRKISKETIPLINKKHKTKF